MGRAGTPFSIEQVDRAVLLESPIGPHSAVVRQRDVVIEVADEPDIIVLSRFHPTIDPWEPTIRSLARRPAATSVRATMFATELAIGDRLELRHAREQLDLAILSASAPVPAILRRAADTVDDLAASFASPLFVGELAVTSRELLPETFVRTVASFFTSELDVHRSSGTVVAGAVSSKGAST